MLIPALARDQRRQVTTIMSVIGAVAALALGHVWTQLRTIEYGYGLARASRVQAQLIENNRRLRTELAMLKSPARLAALAQTELALAAPEPGQRRRLSASLAATRAMPATALRPGSLALAEPADAQRRRAAGSLQGARRRPGPSAAVVAAPLGLLWSAGPRRAAGHPF